MLRTLTVTLSMALAAALPALPVLAQDGPLKIEITDGVTEPMAIAIPPFHGDAAVAQQIRDVVAAEVAAWVNYVCPVVGAQEVLAKTDPDLAESPFIFPSVEYITDNNIQGFRALTPEEEQKYSARWQKVMGN